MNRFNDEQPFGLGVVKVRKAELLTALQDNRAQHRTIFEEAQVGFRKELVRLLDERLAAAKKGKHVNLSAHLPEPEDHTRDYDRIIKMVTMSIDDEIELTNGEFQQYVMDDWSWKQQWVTSNSTYTASLQA